MKEPKSPLPTNADWFFDGIRDRDPARAERLEHVALFDHIAQDMRVALHSAILRRHCRIALDKPSTGEPGERAVLQFPVCPYLFDAFFNARSGYRANYWAAPKFGIQAERALVSLLAGMFAYFPRHLRARKIELHAGASRVEEDVGSCNVATSFLAASLS